MVVIDDDQWAIISDDQWVIICGSVTLHHNREPIQLFTTMNNFAIFDQIFMNFSYGCIISCLGRSNPHLGAGGRHPTKPLFGKDVC